MSDTLYPGLAIDRSAAPLRVPKVPKTRLGLCTREQNTRANQRYDVDREMRGREGQVRWGIMVGDWGGGDGRCG